MTVIRAGGGPLRRAADLFAAEWIKLWSVRSTYLALAAAAAAAHLIAVGVARSIVSYVQHGQVKGSIDANGLAISFRGIAVAQLILGILGAMTMTSEFGSGLIRTTFTAAPRRAPVILAKAGVLIAVTFVFGQALAFSCFFATQATLHSIRVGIGIGAPGVVRAVFGAGFYLTVVTLLGLGIGATVRHTGAAVGTIVAFFFLVPQIPSALPKPWSVDLADAMPSTAAQVISTLRPDVSLLSVPHSYLQLASYAVLVPLLGTLLVHRRDA